MNPQSAGGFQSDALQPARLPGGPPTSGMPFDHRRIGPGGAMGGAMGVPALSIPRPGAVGSSGAPIAKGGFPSNELVVYNVVCNKWTTKKYERFYYIGSLMFGERSGGATHSLANVVSLAQLNEMLREGRQILDSQLSTRPRSGFSIDGAPVNEEIAGLKQHFAAYLEQGEAYLTGNRKLKHDIAKNKVFRKMICLSLEHIADEFRLLGEYTSGENQGKPTVQIVIGAQGPNSHSPLDNVWGEVRQGDKLWLVLKAQRNDDYVEGGGEPEYKYFQFVPRVGHDYPSPDELFYRDPSGAARYGIGIYIGEVLHEPMQFNEAVHRNKMAGLTCGSQEAYEFSRRNTAKVVAVLGSPKARLGEHAW